MDDDEKVCCVCLKEAADGRPLIECKGPGCEVILHGDCYGVPNPPRDWTCALCSQGIHKAQKCQICASTNRKFAMKPTATGTWAHVLCALWTPGVRFRDAKKRDVVTFEGIEPASALEQSCYICAYRGSIEKAVFGFKMGCGEADNESCPKKLHAYCGVKGRLLHTDGTRFWGYCDEHDPEVERRFVGGGKQPKKKGGASEGGPSSPPRDADSKTEKEREEKPSPTHGGATVEGPTGRKRKAEEPAGGKDMKGDGKRDASPDERDKRRGEREREREREREKEKKGDKGDARPPKRQKVSKEAKETKETKETKEKEKEKEHREAKGGDRKGKATAVEEAGRESIDDKALETFVDTEKLELKRFLQSAALATPRGVEALLPKITQIRQQNDELAIKLRQLIKERDSLTTQRDDLQAEFASREEQEGAAADSIARIRRSLLCLFGVMRPSDVPRDMDPAQVDRLVRDLAGAVERADEGQKEFLFVRTLREFTERAAPPQPAAPSAAEPMQL